MITHETHGRKFELHPGSMYGDRTGVSMQVFELFPDGRERDHGEIVRNGSSAPFPTLDTAIRDTKEMLDEHCALVGGQRRN